MNKEQAKQEALALFQEGKPLLYSDVARALRIDLATAVEVCDELISVGEVEESGDSNQSR